jgi:phosphoglycerate kinase
VVLMSHLGRPDGKVIAKFSLKPVAAELRSCSAAGGTFVTTASVPVAEAAAAAQTQAGEVVLLENLRFHIEEEGKVKLEDGTSKKADPAAVRRSAPADEQARRCLRQRRLRHRAPRAFVHGRRESAGKGRGLPDGGRAQGLRQGARDPDRPLLAILGGAKIADKIPLIKNLLEKADKIIIGGGMAYTFHKQLRGMKIGGSLFDAEGAKIVGNSRRRRSARREPDLPGRLHLRRQIRPRRQHAAG